MERVNKNEQIIVMGLTGAAALMFVGTTIGGITDSYSGMLITLVLTVVGLVVGMAYGAAAPAQIKRHQ